MRKENVGMHIAERKFVSSAECEKKKGHIKRVLVKISDTGCGSCPLERLVRSSLVLHGPYH